MSYRVLFSILLVTTLGACNRGAEEPAPAVEPSEGSAAPAIPDGPLVVYSGRNQEMLDPVIRGFEAASGIEVEVNYAGSADLAATLLEEGDRTPAHVFLAQDASTLGVLQNEGVLATLDDEVLSRVDPTYRSPEGAWVGVTGRARVLVYNPTKLSPEELPGSFRELAEPEWRGRFGWAPENASFQSFVAAMVALEGETATQEWLTAVQANGPVAFPSNTPLVTAVAQGTIEMGLTNHYYLYRLRDEHGEDFAAANHYFRSGDAGSFVNVTGAAIPSVNSDDPRAMQFIAFLLSEYGQSLFVRHNREFPLATDAAPPVDLPAANTLQNPQVELSRVADLETAVRLIRAAGALP